METALTILLYGLGAIAVMYVLFMVSVLVISILVVKKDFDK